MTQRYGKAAVTFLRNLVEAKRKYHLSESVWPLKLS